MKGVINAAGLLQKLQAVGLHAYQLQDRIELIEPIVELLAWTLCSNIWA
jgi:hypothetical protein